MYAREGDEAGLQQQIEQGTFVDLKGKLIICSSGTLRRMYVILRALLLATILIPAGFLWLVIDPHVNQKALD